MGTISRIKQIISSRFGNKIGLNARRSFWRDTQAFIKNPSPTIIDGGSNRGEFTDALLSLYQSPKIYAIEANPELAEFLRQKFSNYPEINIIGKAIGSASGQLPLHLANDSWSSSFLERGEPNKKYGGTRTDFYKTVNVPVVRLDSLIPPVPIDMLKLDLEGYELEALKGAAGILKNVKLIFTEVEFVENFVDAPRFAEVEIFLREQNFRFFNFYNLYTQPDGQLTEGDAIFLCRKYP